MMRQKEPNHRTGSTNQVDAQTGCPRALGLELRGLCGNFFLPGSQYRPLGRMATNQHPNPCPAGVRDMPEAQRSVGALANGSPGEGAKEGGAEPIFLMSLNWAGD